MSLPPSNFPGTLCSISLSWLLISSLVIFAKPLLSPPFSFFSSLIFFVSERDAHGHFLHSSRRPYHSVPFDWRVWKLLEQKVPLRKREEAANFGADDNWEKKETKEAIKRKKKTKPLTRTRTADRKGHQQRPFVYSKSFLARTNIDTLVASASLFFYRCNCAAHEFVWVR